MDRGTSHAVGEESWTDKRSPSPAIRMAPLFDRKIYPVISNGTFPFNRTATAQVPTATPRPFPSNTKPDNSGSSNTTVPVALAGLAILVAVPILAITGFFYV